MLDEPARDRETVPSDAIELRTAFDFVRYANCWEDADLLVEALQCGPGKRVLSIASAGDNALALLATGAEVVAVDLNAAQLACVEIRIAAFRNFDHDTLLAFLGIKQPSISRSSLYQSIRNDLPQQAQRFWDGHPREIEKGLIHFGKFERYFQLFRRRVLPWIHRPRTIDALLSPKSLAERSQFWNQRWNNWRWRVLINLFFSRFVMGRLGRDPEFFRYVEGSIGNAIQRRTRHALTQLPTDSNPYLHYLAKGNFLAPKALPRYLRRENYDAIQCGLDRLTLVQGPIELASGELASGELASGELASGELASGELASETAAASRFDAFNLSDIFEYVSDATAGKMYGQLLARANPGARLAYWNAFVPRRCPEKYRNVVTPLDRESEAWFLRDQAFFYRHFQVDEVTSTVPDVPSILT